MKTKTLTIAVALAAIVAAPALATTLEVEIVEARDFMVAFEINDAMQVCGDNQIASTTTALVWNPLGGSDDVTIMPGADGISQAGDINTFGDVVGWFESAATGEDTAVIWYADSGYQNRVELGLPSDIYLYTQGYAINDSGDVAVNAGLEIYREMGEDPFYLSSDPYRWTPGEGYAALPHLSGARESYGFDINAEGTIVGYSVDLSGQQVAVSWSKNNKLNVLGAPEGSLFGGVARAINNAGTVVGSDGRDRDSWVWTKKDGFRVLPDYGYNAIARDINEHGVIAGVADVFPFESTPVVWDADGNMYSIQDVLGYNQYYFTDGVAINNNDEFVVYGINLMTGRRQAVVLRLTFVD